MMMMMMMMTMMMMVMLMMMIINIIILIARPHTKGQNVMDSRKHDTIESSMIPHPQRNHNPCQGPYCHTLIQVDGHHHNLTDGRRESIIEKQNSKGVSHYMFIITNKSNEAV